jgi:hypothetical protein
MFSNEPKGRIETGEIPMLGRSEESLPKKGPTAGRSLTIFKSLVLATLMAITFYGMLSRGLYSTERWLLVIAAILGLFFISLFVVNYFADVPWIAWVLVGFLVVLVGVKGLSLTWSISRIETVKELLRSSTYLITFTLAVASLSSRRLVGPFIDGMSLVVGAVAGYGVLQKTNPVEYTSNTPYDVGVGSTLEYSNTVAMVLGMGVVIGLGRMTQLNNPIVRGLYAALILVFGAILYLTFSFGGMVALGVGLVVLFIVGGSRLQMLANLLLISMPLVWLVWKVQGLESFFAFVPEESVRAADGLAFRTDLAIAIFAAFLLQVIYAALIKRYEPAPYLHRLLGAAVVVILVGALGFAVVGGEQRGADYIKDQIISLSSNYRASYWRVAWDEWKEHPLRGTGAGTFMYTWQQERPGFDSTKQVHNVYLQQGTETGVFAFLALVGFALLLMVYLVRGTLLRDHGQWRILLSGLTAAVIIYLLYSAFEWHWHIPPSTIFFFVLAGVAAKFASGAEQDI